jgi:hypothetical protein
MQKIKVTPAKAIEFVLSNHNQEVWSEIHTNAHEAAQAWSGYVLRKRYGSRPSAGRYDYQMRAFDRCFPIFKKMFA